MLKIKLTRTGKKNYSTYKIVVNEARDKRDGKYLDLIGIYNPNTHPLTLKFNQKKIDYWISKGAQPTLTVARLINK
ncbi:MAG: 30S ribosomal protein S16 [Patescibacteria group bacterium]|nr:30S ribosomal protein S16 [Patescibacteria group bacterium]